MSERAKRVSKLETETYLFFCKDGEKTPPLREEHLFGHLDHIEANNQHYRVAGPMRDEASGKITGSFFLIAADSEEDAWAVMNGDPYIKSDMFESITVQHLVPACGEWLGGVIWDQNEIRANMEKYSKG